MIDIFSLYQGQIVRLIIVLNNWIIKIIMFIWLTLYQYSMDNKKHSFVEKLQLILHFLLLFKIYFLNFLELSSRINHSNKKKRNFHSPAVRVPLLCLCKDFWLGRENIIFHNNKYIVESIINWKYCGWTNHGSASTSFPLFPPDRFPVLPFSWTFHNGVHFNANQHGALSFIIDATNSQVIAFHQIISLSC